MRRVRVPLMAASLALATLLSCVGGDSPVGPDGGSLVASLAVVPVFPVQARSLTAAPVNLIRLTVLALPANTQVTQLVTAVDPNASQWELSLEVPLSSEPGVQYVLEIELINEEAGVQTVQWSGRAGPLTLTAGTAPAIREVGVTRGPLDNLSVTSLVVEGPSTVPEQEDFTLTALVQVADAAAQPTVFWTSLDPTIASIEANGQGRGLRAGTARIEAQAGPLTVVHQIQVMPVPDAVEVSPAAVELTDVGQIAEFTAMVLDRSGSAIPGAAVTWTAADDRIVESLGDGSFLAVAAGQTAVTATSVDDSELSASGLIDVTLIPVAMTLEPAEVTLTQVGATAALATNVVTAGGVSVFGLATSWSTSDAAVATVSLEGLVTAVGPGEAVITAQTEVVGDPPAPLAATATVTVVLTASAVQVTPESATLTTIGQQQTLQATAIDAIGGPISDPSVTWTSSNTSVATVTAAGVVTALADGTATITAQVDDASGSATVTVDIAVDAVTVDPPTATLPVGTTVTLTAVALDGLGAQVPVSFTWSTSDALVATVSPDGVVTANEFGAALITATAKGVSGSATITVSGLAEPQSSFYETVGNTELATGAYVPLGPAHVYVADNALAPSPGLTITSVGTFPSTQSGQVDLQADGDFSYTPPLGFEGTDQFDFTVVGGATATVEIEVIGMVWYVDATSDGFGLSNAPRGGGTVGGPGDRIFVYSYGSPSPVLDGFNLQDGQKLIGEGTGLDIPPFGQLMPPGLPPVITTSSAGVTLANNTFVSGLELRNTDDGIYGNAVSNVLVEDVRIIDSDYDGVALNGVTGTFTFNNLQIDGAAKHGFLVSGGDAVIEVNLGGPIGIQNAAEFAVRVSNTLGGELTFNFGDIVSTGGWGVSVGGSQTDVMFNSAVSLTNVVGEGLRVANSSGPLYLSSLDIVNPGANAILVGTNTGLITVADGTIQTVDNSALFVDDANVNLNLSSVSVNNADSGDGIFMQDVAGTTTIGLLDVAHEDSGTALWLQNAGTFNVTNPASTILGNSDSGLHLFNTDVDLSFASVEINGPFTDGLDMSGLTGSIAIAGGNISNTSGDGVSLVNSEADFFFGGSIVNPSGKAVGTSSVYNSAIQFTGPIQSTGGGISLTDSDGTSFLFSGTLDLQTGANPAFVASTDGTVEVTGTGNIINTTTGQPVNISSTDIGPGNVTFQSVSTDGTTVGINLNNTGTSGSFRILGTGTPGSGGLIQNTANNGMLVVNTQGLELHDLTLSNTGGHSIGGNTVQDFVFDGVQILNSGFRGLALSTVTGIGVISNTTVDGQDEGSLLNNSTGLLVLDISSSTFNASSGSLAGGALEFLSSGSSDLQATVSDLTVTASSGGGVKLTTSANAVAEITINSTLFGQNTGPHLSVATNDASAVELVVTGISTFDMGADDAIRLSSAGTSGLKAEISHNVFTSLTGHALSLSGTVASGMHIRAFGNDVTGSSAGAGIWGSTNGSAFLDGWIADNTITGTALPGIIFESGLAGAGSPSMDLNVSSNVVGSTAPDPRMAFYHDQSASMCLSVTGNSTASGAAIGIAAEQMAGATEVLKLERLQGGTVTDELLVESHLEDENPDAPTTAATVVTGFDGLGSGTCAIPLPPTAATNAAPAAHPQRATTDGATPKVILLTGADGDPADVLTFTIVTPPSTGALGAITPISNRTAEVTYTPAGVGIDLFSFQVDDGTAITEAVVVMDNLAPAPLDAAYTTVGNTELVAGGFEPASTPAVEDPFNVFDPTPGLTADVTGSFASTAGGDVELSSDGGFSYIPPAGFTGDDTFPVSTASGTATVTVTVTDMVWWVDNTAGGGDGRSDAPFNTLLAASSSAGPGDAIFVFAGDLTPTGYDQGIGLLSGQRLIGEVAGLTIVGVGELVPPGGPRPIIHNLSAGSTIGIGTTGPANNSIRGLTINSSSGPGLLAADLGTTVVDDVVIVNSGAGIQLNSSVGSITLTNMDVTGEDAVAFAVSGGSPDVTYDGSLTGDLGTLLDVSNTTGGTLTFTGSNTVLAEAGVIVLNSASTLVMDNLDVSSFGTAGILIQISTGSFTFTDVTMNLPSGNAIAVTGGAPTVSVDVAPAGIANDQSKALTVTGTTGGSVSLTGGPITDIGGDGVQITSNAGSVSVANALTVTDPGAGSSGAVYLDGSNGEVTLSNVTIATSLFAPGLVHVNGTGLLTVLDGSIEVTGTATMGLNVLNAPVDLTLSGITVTSTDPDYDLVEIQNSPGSMTTIGTLALTSTGAGTPLKLNNAGTFTASTGLISSTNNTGVEIVNTALDVTLAELSVNHTFGTGVSIASSSGTFIAGGGALVSSGTGAVDLNNNTDLDFTYDGTINNSAGPAVLAWGNTATAGFFNFPGNITGTGEGIQLNDNQGTTTSFSGNLDVNIADWPALVATGWNTLHVTGATNTLTTTGGEAITLHHLRNANTLNNVSANSPLGVGLGILQDAPGATLAINGGQFNNNYGGITVRTRSSGQLTLTLAGATISDNSSEGLFASAEGSSTFDLTVGGTLDGNGTGIRLGNTANGVLTFDVNGNSITNSVDQGVYIRTGTATGNLEGFVRNNTITDSGLDGVLVETFALGLATVEVNNNTVSTSAVGGTQGIAARAGIGAPDSGDLHLTVLNNAVGAGQYGHGLDLQSHGTALFCANVQGNAITDPSGYGDFGIGVWQAESSTYQLERFTGTPTVIGDVEAHLIADNPPVGAFIYGAGPVAVFIDAGGFSPVADGFCRVPTP